VVVEPIPSILQRFVAQKVVLLQTRKRDGTWVDTPVNIAVEGARAYFRTPALASKNKRLRNFPEVRLAPCTWLGRTTGPAVEATARRLAGEESVVAGRLINRKHPVLQRRLVPLIHRMLRTETVHYELTGTRALTTD
jgi:PPOX class probable F420-dependent enzyme